MSALRPLVVSTVMALAAITAGSALAQEGRLSLAERVARLEQQQVNPAPAPSSGGNLELLNRIQELQSEVQSLRGQVEQQTFEIEDLKNRQRTQYIDLDTRIQRLGSGGTDAGGELELDLDAASRGDSAAAAPTTPALTPAPPPDSDQLLMEDAPAVDPYTGEAIARTEPAAPDAAAAAAAVPSSGDPESDYQAGFDALREGRYADSTRQFTDFTNRYPDHDLADNAWYWLGESYYVTQNYESALNSFRSLIERYPDGDKIADAELKIGYCLYELGRRDEARTALETVTRRYPDSTVSRLAQSRLRALDLDRL